MKPILRPFLPLLVLAACSNEPAHVLAGNWTQELPGGAVGMSLEFDGKGERVVVHGAPRPDGSHGHPKATFTWDAATKTLTMKGDLVVDGKEGTWTGKLEGDRMELGAADGKLVFRRGGKPAGH
jgi:hypothetical protein